MGQKANPIGLRLGKFYTWDSLWYAKSKKGYSNYLYNDLSIRAFLSKKLANSSVSKIVIERLNKKINVNVHSSRPGLIIGKKGDDINIIRGQIEKIAANCTGGDYNIGSNDGNCEVSLNVIEQKKPDLDAVLVADSIARQIKGRASYKKVMKKAMLSTMKAGASGVKISVSGRLGGAEIARREWYKEGRIPLHTLRANIKYAKAEAQTQQGVIGVTVWIYLGEKH